MKIIIEGTNHLSLSIDLAANDESRVRDIRRSIELSYPEISLKNIDLIFRARRLDDDEKLASAGIEDSSVVSLAKHVEEEREEDRVLRASIFSFLVQFPMYRSIIHHMSQNFECYFELFRTSPQFANNPTIRRMVRNRDLFAQSISATDQLLASEGSDEEFGSFIQNILGSQGAFCSRFPFFGAGHFGCRGSEEGHEKPPEERFRQQLDELRDMGFKDEQRNIEALTQANGILSNAIDIISNTSSQQ